MVKEPDSKPGAEPQVIDYVPASPDGKPRVDFDSDKVLFEQVIEKGLQPLDRTDKRPGLTEKLGLTDSHRDLLRIAKFIFEILLLAAIIFFGIGYIVGKLS